MLDALESLVNEQPALVRRGRWTHAVMLIEIGANAWTVTMTGGRIAVAPVTGDVIAHDFAIRGSEDAFAAFWSDPPPPRRHDLIALVREGSVRLEGNLDLMMANLLYIKLMLETLRGRM